MKRSFLWEADIQTRSLNFLHGIQYFLAKSPLVFVCLVFLSFFFFACWQMPVTGTLGKEFGEDFGGGD